jgi:cob(I)alamin adenosyltransferase
MKKIYTKTGDKGKTGLINGERLAKDSLVFEVLGTLDEFNAGLGLVVADFNQLKGAVASKEKAFLIDLQRQLFNLGAEIAKSPKTKFETKFLKKMESQIDNLQAALSKNWLNRFVLPGGSKLAARIDLARTICRRLERRLVSLDNERDLRDILIKFINRTSDYLYVLRSFVNKELKVKEELY